MTLTTRDIEDMQGNVLTGYRYPIVAHLFGTIRSGEERAWKAWLRSLVPHLTPADWGGPQNKPDFTLNIGLSHSALGFLLPKTIAAEIGDRFVAYRDGMPNRRALLGDGSAYPFWDARHVWVSIHARTPAAIRRGIKRVRRSLPRRLRLELESPIGRAIVKPARERNADPTQAKGHWYEHFGFRDDISYPVIEGAPHLHENDVNGRGRFDEAREAWVPIAAGEFVLGHVNEAGQNVLSNMSATARELLQNGTFGAFRRLHQDVSAFRAYVSQHATGAGPEHLAACMMGRTRAGQPLVDPEGDVADFRYDQDKHGARCPLGAHVRRVNPRVDGRHRIIRRGITYGPEAPPAGDNKRRGLWFVAFNADIENQFEFLQRRWIDGPFGNLSKSRDPIVAAEPTRSFAIEGDHELGRLPKLLLNIPSFVTCEGGQYYFMPSRRGLHLLSADDSQPAPRAPVRAVSTS